MLLRRLQKFLPHGHPPGNWATGHLSRITKGVESASRRMTSRKLHQGLGVVVSQLLSRHPAKWEMRCMGSTPRTLSSTSQGVTTHVDGGNRNKDDFEFLRSHPAYRDLYYHQELDKQTLAASLKHPAAKAFVELAITSPDTPIFDEKFKPIIQPLLETLKELTEEELLHVLYHFRFFPRVSKEFKEEYAKIWTIFDEECINRGVERKRWRAAVNFVYADLWSFVLLGRFSGFHWILVKSCIRKVDSLPREKFVRLCQSVCASKKLSKEIKLYNIEFNLPRIIADSEQNKGRPITTQELAAICAVYYKMKAVISNMKLVGDIIDICTKHSETISSSSLYSICTGISMAKHLRAQENVNNLLTAMITQVNRLEGYGLSALLFLACRSRVQNLDFMTAAAHRLEDLVELNPRGFNFVDLEWIAKAFEDLDNPSSSAFKSILKCMYQLAATYRDPHNSQSQTNEIDLNAEPKTKSQEDKIAIVMQKRLVPVLKSLTYGGIYPLELISKVLSKDYLDKTYGSSMYTYPLELLILDQTVATDLKGYNGPRLAEKSRGFLSKKNMEWVQPLDNSKCTSYNAFVRHVYKPTVNIFGNPSCVHVCNILPHLLSIELVFCTSNSGKLIPVPEIYKSKEPFNPKSLTSKDFVEDGMKYHAMILYHGNHLLWGSNKPIGSRSIIKKKIKEMNYATYELSLNECLTLDTEEKMQAYIKDVLTDGGNNEFPFMNFQNSSLPLELDYQSKSI